MKDNDNEMAVRTEHNGAASRIAWLIAGVGIGAVAGILLTPQSGEDTREWISTKVDDGISTARAKAKRARRRVGDWVDQGQQRITDAVDAGREAFNKGVKEAGR
jgi:gas vesicle protein